MVPVAPKSSQGAILSLGEALIIDATAQARERDLPLLGIGVSVPGSVDTDQCRVIDSPALGASASVESALFLLTLGDGSQVNPSNSAMTADGPIRTRAWRCPQG